MPYPSFNDLTVAEVSDELRHLAKIASYDKLYRF